MEDHTSENMWVASVWDGAQSCWEGKREWLWEELGVWMKSQFILQNYWRNNLKKCKIQSFKSSFIKYLKWVCKNKTRKNLVIVTSWDNRASYLGALQWCYWADTVTFSDGLAGEPVPATEAKQSTGFMELVSYRGWGLMSSLWKNNSSPSSKLNCFLS